MEETETCCHYILEALGFRWLKGVQEEGIEQEEEFEDGQGCRLVLREGSLPGWGSLAVRIQWRTWLTMAR